MDWILPGLAIGNIEDAMGHDDLQREGVRSVLTLNDFPNLRGRGFHWHRVFLHDGPGNAAETLIEAVDHLERMHREEPPVLVHCAEGKSRSALVVALYVARTTGLALEDAFAVVKAQRRQAAVDDVLWALGAEVAAGG